MLRDVLGDSEWLGLLHWVFEDELLCHLRIFVVPEAQEATTQMWIHVSWFRTRQTLLPKCTSCYRVLCIRGLAVCWTGFGCALISLIVHSSGKPCGMQPRISLYHVPPLRSRWMSPHGWRQGLSVATSAMWPCQGSGAWIMHCQEIPIDGESMLWLNILHKISRPRSQPVWWSDDRLGSLGTIWRLSSFANCAAIAFGICWSAVQIVMLRRFWALKRLRTSLQIPLASRRGSSVHCEKLRLLKFWNQVQEFFGIFRNGIKIKYFSLSFLFGIGRDPTAMVESW